MNRKDTSYRKLLNFLRNLGKPSTMFLFTRNAMVKNSYASFTHFPASKEITNTAIKEKFATPRMTEITDA